MNFFLTITAKRLKQGLILLVSLLFTAGIFYTEKKNITVFAQHEPQAIYSVVTNQKVLALTFDIGWGDKRPDAVLQVLKEKGVKKATFFLSAPWAKEHPDTVKAIVEAGYEVGSHGNRHVNYSTLTDEDIRKQIQASSLTLGDLLGKPPTIIRFPNGDFDKRVLRIADEAGYTTIQWDTDSLDWMNKGVDEIINRVVTKAHPGDIILMHASDSSKQTHLALPSIIDQLRAQGYQFATVSELIHSTHISDKEVRDKN